MKLARRRIARVTGMLGGGVASADYLTSLLANFPGGDEVVFTSDISTGGATKYQMHQHLVDNIYSYIVLQSAGGAPAIGNAWMQIHESRVSEFYHGHNTSTTPAITTNIGLEWALYPSANDAYWGGCYVVREGTVGAYMQLITEDNCTTVGALVMPDIQASSMCLVTIDGDGTLADLLPTAQDLVTFGTLASTALVANGGTLNPTDRMLDLVGITAATTNTRGTGTPVFFSRSLSSASHTVKIQATAETHVGTAHTNNIVLVCMFSGGGNAALVTGATSKPVFIKKANIYTLASMPPVWEISWSNQPEGGTYKTWVGHSGSLFIKVLPIVKVDGVTVTPANFTTFVGDEVKVITQNNVMHPETGATNIGVLDLTYTTNKATGLTISHSLAWATNGVAEGYPGMFTVDKATFDRYNMINSGVVGGDLTDNDDALNFNTTGKAAYCWDSDGYVAGLMYIPDLLTTVDNWSKAITRQFYWADIAGNVWKKAYATRFSADEAYTNTTVWASIINYRTTWIASGADAAFNALK